jgi:enolase
MISELRALEILDSRGRPTVRAFCVLSDGASGSASVPSGASTGAAEAHERRDADRGRYGGLGCRGAVAAIEGEIRRALAGRAVSSQADLDRALVALDGTPDKSRLGANAILAVSLAYARACANARGIPLFRQFAQMTPRPAPAMPRPMINLFSGGRHAGGQVAIQDVLIMPVGARSMDEALATAHRVYRAAAEHIVQARYAERPLVADEGGLAPAFGSAGDALQAATEAIGLAGLRAGADAALALDVAASHFFERGVYRLDGETLQTDAMIDRLLRWLEAAPIVSLEDGLAQDDWSGWAELRRRVAGRAWVVGDDLLCTNPSRIRRAIDAGAADALLLKVNQIGTLTEAAEALGLARAAGWRVIVSARSGETEDDWLADLAVGWAADAVKIGSIARSERLAKYNRLLEIEKWGGL